MPFTWVPTVNQGYWQNGMLIGVGEALNEIDCILQKGTFNSKGQLNGNDCVSIDYSDASLVTIKKGTFSSGLEDGTIYEYVFPKSRWNTLIGNGTIATTRYTRTYTDGVLTSTDQTQTNFNITGGFTYTDKFECCGFTDA